MAWSYNPRQPRKSGGSKYGATKVTIDGQTFASKKEARRYQELKALERAGVIADLQTQMKFLLIPAQREPDIIGPKGGRKPGKLLERECAYIADFVYIDKKTGKPVVEDTKGFRTEAYRIKKKLMLERHGVQIKEI